VTVFELVNQRYIGGTLVVPVFHNLGAASINWQRSLFATTMALPPNVDMVRPRARSASFMVVLKGVAVFEERLLGFLAHARP
jgi:hypothetical protein